jgi:hypothetical protein
MPVNRSVVSLFSLSIAIMSVAASDLPKSARFGPDYAEITLVKGNKDMHFGMGSSQYFSKSRAGKCEQERDLANFNTLSGKRKKVLLKADERIVIHAQFSNANISVYTSGSMSVSQCSSTAIFTPQPSGQYEIEQKVGAKGCYLAVTDRATCTEVPGTNDLAGATCEGPQR